MRTEKKTERTLRLKSGDIFLYVFFILLLGVILLLQFTVFGKSSGDSVRISCGEKTQTYSLSDTRTITVEQNGITLTVEIADGGVRVSHADCPDRICERTGIINKARQSIVCLPAHCEISIVGTSESEVDGIVG